MNLYKNPTILFLLFKIFGCICLGIWLFSILIYDKQPTFNNITSLLYNDENKNKKCDQGELVVTSIDNTMENEDKVSFATEGYNYTDYEAYYNPY